MGNDDSEQRQEVLAVYEGFVRRMMAWEKSNAETIGMVRIETLSGPDEPILQKQRADLLAIFDEYCLYEDSPKRRFQYSYPNGGYDLDKQEVVGVTVGRKNAEIRTIDTTMGLMPFVVIYPLRKTDGRWKLVDDRRIIQGEKPRAYPFPL